MAEPAKDIWICKKVLVPFYSHLTWPPVQCDNKPLESKWATRTNFNQVRNIPCKKTRGTLQLQRSWWRPEIRRLLSCQKSITEIGFFFFFFSPPERRSYPSASPVYGRWITLAFTITAIFATVKSSNNSSFFYITGCSWGLLKPRIENKRHNIIL